MRWALGILVVALAGGAQADEQALPFRAIYTMEGELTAASDHYGLCAKDWIAYAASSPKAERPTVSEVAADCGGLRKALRAAAETLGQLRTGGRTPERVDAVHEACLEITIDVEMVRNSTLAVTASTPRPGLATEARALRTGLHAVIELSDRCGDLAR